jgi:hypothetical protein
MALTITMASMHESGQYVVQCKLWQYYLIEIQQAFFTNYGRSAADPSAAVITAFEHILCSVVGGAGMLGIGWVVHKIRNR